MGTIYKQLFLVDLQWNNCKIKIRTGQGCTSHPWSGPGFRSCRSMGTLESRSETCTMDLSVPRCSQPCQFERLNKWEKKKWGETYFCLQFYQKIQYFLLFHSFQFLFLPLCVPPADTAPVQQRHWTLYFKGHLGRSSELLHNWYLFLAISLRLQGLQLPHIFQ